jgi:hypothetical protein
LKQINGDTMATLSVFKQVIKSGSILSLEDVTNAQFTKRNGNSSPLKMFKNGYDVK